jgi:hypothetical protein
MVGEKECGVLRGARAVYGYRVLGRGWIVQAGWWMSAYYGEKKAMVSSIGVFARDLSKQAGAMWE